MRAAQRLNLSRYAWQSLSHGYTNSVGAAACMRTIATGAAGSSAQDQAWLQYLKLGSIGALGAGLLLHQSQPAHAEQQQFADQEFTPEEVAKHRTPKDRVWVTYKDGVYDITDFVAQHPGGAEKIMLAAGGSIEPFWAMYQQHNKQEIHDMLKQYRIGTLKGAKTLAPVADPYSNEPARHPALLARSQKPFNAETPSDILAAGLITPNDMFYVRNHLPVPEIDAATYRLEIEGEGLKTIALSLDDLKTKFRKHSVATTVMCAGNRRNEMKAIKPVKGLDWDNGAIGTAVWSGVRLKDVLEYAGLTADEQSAQHIHFVGLDTDMVGTPYICSIPLHKALDGRADVLLAYEMNGQPLSRDHGAPLRAIVPGVVGARNVKWLGKVVSSQSEAQSLWQQRDYKAFSPSTGWDNVDWGSAPAIQEPPVLSAICEPKPGAKVYASDGEVALRGYAWSGGGKDIIRVDVSADGGKTWTAAKLQKLPQQADRAWAWSLFEATLPLPEESAGQQLELVAKAVDASYNSQPDSVAAIWNLRGVVNNAWHRVKVEVVADEYPVSHE